MKASAVFFAAAFILVPVVLLRGETSPQPDPSLSPGNVVRIQLEALRTNDSTDAGIAVTFGFASPANKASTGPLPRFVDLVKSPPYEPMLNFLGVEYLPIETSGSLARLRVRLTGRGGQVVRYAFYLSKQTDPPYEGCWMTDAVVVEEWEENSLST
jgi:hypothetical protein